MFPNSGQNIGQNYWQYFCNLLWNSCPQERSNCEVMTVMWRSKTKDLSFWPFFKNLCCCYFSFVASKLIGQFCKSFLPFHHCQTIHRCPYFRMKFPDCLSPLYCTWSFYYFKFILFQQNELLEVHSVEVFSYGLLGKSSKLLTTAFSFGFIYWNILWKLLEMAFLRMFAGSMPPEPPYFGVPLVPDVFLVCVYVQNFMLCSWKCISFFHQCSFLL